MVMGYGAPPERCRAVLIGESPGRHEARTKVPFVGPSGQLLRSLLKQAGFDVLSCKDAAEGEMEEPEVYITNAALCLPIGGDIDQYKTSQKKKAAAKLCFPRLKAEIMPYAQAGVPILAMGGAASLVMVGIEAIGSIRSRWWSRGPIKILTTWHPAYILRQPVRTGELARDIRKLAHGGPKYAELVEEVRGVENRQYAIIDTPHKLRMLESQLIAGCADGTIQDSTVCLDIESDNVDWWKDKILCYGLSWGMSADQCAIIPEEMVYTSEVRDFFIRLFERRSIKWLGHNFKFDIRFIRHQTGVHNARVDYDSLIADHIIDENRRHALKDLLTEFYDVPDYEKKLVQRYLKNKNDMYSKVPRPHLYHYCIYDVIWTLMLWRDLRRQLEASGLFEQPFLYPTMASQPMLLDMELRGMLIDKGAMSDLSRTLHHDLDQTLEGLREQVGLNFNPNSPKQVSHIMYDILNLPKQKVRGLKPVSTAEPIRLLILKKMEADGVEDSPKYRWLYSYQGWKKMEKIRSSYVDNTIPLIDENGRVHPDILVYGTETGRLSVRNPALQTIPRADSGEAFGERWGKRIKQCYAAPPGYALVQVDYSQAELRTAAWMAQDEFLMDCYRDGRDIHGEVAEALYPGWHDRASTPEGKFQRKRTKMCVFGRVYLGTEYTIAETLHCSLREAREKLAIIDGLLGGLVEWEHEQVHKMRTQGYVETLTNRRRRMPLVTQQNMDDARKAACNSPVQGTASALTTISAITVYNWLEGEYGKVEMRPYIVLLIHDSIMLEVPLHLVYPVAIRVKEIMERVAAEMMPGIPWKADVEVGSSWGELKETDVLSLEENYQRQPELSIVSG
jgi:DNA polymerase-1